MITADRRSASPRRISLLRTGSALLAAGALVLSACSPSDTTSPSADGGGADELLPMTVVTFLPLESFTFTPEMYAYSGGYFEKHGLDVQLEPVQGTSAAIQSLLGGATTITRASTVDVFPAMEQGQPIRSVGTMTYKSNLQVVSVQSKPITSPAEMQGSVMGMGSVGGTSEKMLNLALGAADISLDTVERQAVPVTAATIEVVRTGALHGYIVSLDTSIAIAQQNEDAVVDDAGLGEAPDIQTWITTADNLDQPEEVEKIERFLAAIQEAVQDVIDDSGNDYSTVLGTLRDSGDWNFPALADDEVAIAALDIYTTEMWVNQSDSVNLLGNDLDAWTATYDAYAEAGMVDGNKDPLEWIIGDYVPNG